MNYIKGKFRQFIFEADSGYKIGLFKVTETSDNDIPVNKVLTFTGYFGDINKDDTYILNGEYICHDRYGYQFNSKSYEKVKPEGKEAIIDFLTSSFVKGCGVSTAKKIYNIFGDKTLEKIKENKDNLLLVPKIGSKTVDNIYTSIIKYYDADKEIVELQKMGFSIKETMNLMRVYGKNIMNVINENIYQLIDYIDFPKLDKMFLDSNDINDDRRIKACIIASMKKLTFANGDVFLSKKEIVNDLENYYHITKNVSDDINALIKTKEIIVFNDDYYLMQDYLDELNNALCISKLVNTNGKVTKFRELMLSVQEELNINYNMEQINAIKLALTNNISIITGGPGTGKTTIIKGLISAYAKIHKLSDKGIKDNIMLLAPTGRASKRMAESCLLPASTIHRFLKWDKEKNVFNVNEYNKEHFNLYIIDETSMIDNHLLSSLFKGIDLNTKIVFVGDEYQLPSVGPGLVLSDMINAGVPHLSLETIYRQSDNSYIPILAKQIKDKIITDEVSEKRDDYNFIPCSNQDIKGVLTQILTKIKEKGINESSVQILAPMYKGENGIDNLNVLLQDIFNPKKKKKDYKFGTIFYRVGDKVLNLVNDVESNIYNGDIGYITDINPEDKNECVIVNYDGNKVAYKSTDLVNITHAYAITIHKSQGSEFEHVIMPITGAYSRMLYNKLLYTGVSRAKKSLVIIGSLNAFNSSINNNYSVVRKTKLKDKIMNNLRK